MDDLRGYDLLGYDVDELCALAKGIGLPAFRGKQLYEWLMKGADFGDMRNIPAELRKRLADEGYRANSVEIHRVVNSQIDGTVKFLFRLADGHLVEGVLMRYHHGTTLCLSTQVGCRMGCVFCASTLDGCVRNLMPGEMLGQVILANKHAGERVHHVVLMGSGEPMDNYDSVVKFIRLATDARGLDMAMRGISLSSCGLVPKIREFADEGLAVTLSLSLHAPTDEIRQRIMPIAKAYTIAQTIDVCKYYIEKTGRRVIIEYALIGGINAELEHADALAQCLRGMQCHVNLIPLNAVEERDLRPPGAATVRAFLDRLQMRHISATVRREMGSDIQGACGQLRRREMNAGGADKVPASGEVKN